MAETLHPGVFVEEASFGAKPIEGVPTGSAGNRDRVALDETTEAHRITGDRTRVKRARRRPTPPI